MRAECLKLIRFPRGTKPLGVMALHGFATLRMAQLTRASAPTITSAKPQTLNPKTHPVPRHLKHFALQTFHSSNNYLNARAAHTETSKVPAEMSRTWKASVPIP